MRTETYLVAKNVDPSKNIILTYTTKDDRKELRDEIRSKAEFIRMGDGIVDPRIIQLLFHGKGLEIKVKSNFVGKPYYQFLYLGEDLFGNKI